MSHTLIANTGIQVFTFPLSIDTQEKFKLWYHEWYEEENGEWKLETVKEINTEENRCYYNKYELFKRGYLSEAQDQIDVKDLEQDDITPLRIDDEYCSGVKGEIFPMTFQDKDCTVSKFENQWIPVPYFFKRTAKKFLFGSLNWARLKLIPVKEEAGVRSYNAVLAFDTRAKYTGDDYNEFPVFPDKFRAEMDFELCSNEFMVMDYCNPGEKWSYIDDYLFSLVHPEVQKVTQIKGSKVRRMAYIASYTFLINYLATHSLLPPVKLYKDVDVESKNVDMVVDIGNSKTTALLIEDSHNFNQVRHLQLTDYTNMLVKKGLKLLVNKHMKPFDMRLAFRRVSFGEFGIKDSKQFVYPSLVRLGEEANVLIHRATNTMNDVDTLSTYSSPKRYLWDFAPSKQEWKFLVLPGEKDDHTLYINGITNQLRSNGQIDPKGQSGSSFHYSRRSLMTFAFLEMLVQARTQINSEEYRSTQAGFGEPSKPRKIKRVIVTCPTAMSKIERQALVHCAKDAVIMLENFAYDNPADNPKPGSSIEVIPSVSSMRDDDEQQWYYDEATSSQLVYMYGEVGHKYKGNCNEFFNLYGKKEDGDSQNSITVGSLDIGAGTTDLMISKYSYEKGDVTTITPDPKFYDSFYYAGDDMLYALIKDLMILDEGSAFRIELGDMPFEVYRQKMKNFFGKDYNGQTKADRLLRRDFNIQYSVPLMSYYLELLTRPDCTDCEIGYNDVFKTIKPNEAVIEGFKQKTGIDITTLSWNFEKDHVADVIRKEFEPLLKKVATIMYSYACDVVLLSGRPSSLPPIRDLFLKYYSVSPNRLIVLNGYYVGDWYPFSENTGYIKDPKTIVAMGGIIAHYASQLSNLNKFIINLNLLKKNLKSTVNYIETSRESDTIAYVITPEKNTGELTVSSLPEQLYVRQIGLDSYPSRALYSIDFNRQRIGDRIRKRALLNGESYPSDNKVAELVNEEIDKQKRRMPFKLALERDPNDKEGLSITSIIDRNDADVVDSNLEIHIQSLGVNTQYWLDTGEFDF